MSPGGRVLTQKPWKRHHIRPVKLPAHFYMTSHVSHWDIWSTTCFSATPSLVNNPSYTLLLVITVKSYWFHVLDFGEVLTLICYEFPFSVELIYVLYCPKNNLLCNDGWEKNWAGGDVLDLIKMKAWNCHKIKIHYKHNAINSLLPNYLSIWRALIIHEPMWGFFCL